MTAAYDPARCERLCREARSLSGDPGLISSDPSRGILAAIADQLEAARLEVERLTRLNTSQSRLLGENAATYGAMRRAHEAEVETLARTRRETDTWKQMYNDAEESIGALRQRIDGMRARLSVMTDAAAGATADANRALEREQAALTRAFERTTKLVTGFDYTDVNTRLDAETTAFPTDEDLP